MALQITTTTTGGSSTVEPTTGAQWVLTVEWAGTAGDADLQVGYGSTFIDARDVNGVVNITSDYAVIVPGGMDYRLDVNTHTSAATLTAHKVAE